MLKNEYLNSQKLPKACPPSIGTRACDKDEKKVHLSECISWKILNKYRDWRKVMIVLRV